MAGSIGVIIVFQSYLYRTTRRTTVPAVEALFAAKSYSCSVQALQSNSVAPSADTVRYFGLAKFVEFIPDLRAMHSYMNHYSYKAHCDTSMCRGAKLLAKKKRPRVDKIWPNVCENGFDECSHGRNPRPDRALHTSSAARSRTFRSAF